MSSAVRCACSMRVVRASARRRTRRPHWTTTISPNATNPRNPERGTRADEQDVGTEDTDHRCSTERGGEITGHTVPAVARFVQNDARHEQRQDEGGRGAGQKREVAFVSRPQERSHAHAAEDERRWMTRFGEQTPKVVVRGDQHEREEDRDREFVRGAARRPSPRPSPAPTRMWALVLGAAGAWFIACGRGPSGIRTPDTRVKSPVL